MITAWCWTEEQEISDQFWVHCKCNLLNFSPVLFLTQYAVWQLKKIIAIKNLDNSYQDRQTSAKCRNFIFQFKEFRLFLASAPSQLIFLNVFLTQYAVWQLANLKPGPVVHSRWLTTACRLLRLYVETTRSTKNSVNLFFPIHVETFREWHPQ
jgi:hypothetical protein